MTLLSELAAKLPRGCRIELAMTQTGKGIGTFEVADVNCAPGHEDTLVLVATGRSAQKVQVRCSSSVPEPSRIR